MKTTFGKIIKRPESVTVSILISCHNAKAEFAEFEVIIRI